MVDRRGQQLGNYTLVQLLGRGGFADVYLAEHVYLKTQVAVKVLQTHLSTTEDMNSFLREAQLIARLSHPHIIRVLDFGLDDDIPFLVMDYAPGGTLRQYHPRERPLPLALVISYVNQLADALQYAHGEKVIHRDLKPENMLFGRRHEVLLSDFGIALIAQSSRYQGTQEVAGTVAYMALSRFRANRARLLTNTLWGLSLMNGSVVIVLFTALSRKSVRSTSLCLHRLYMKKYQLFCRRLNT